MSTQHLGCHVVSQVHNVHLIYYNQAHILVTRLTWVVGQCGIWEGLLCITLCNIVTLVTTVSMSAVATNGQISGGGVYFMISRSLGPEFGGAIGLMFTLANSIAVAMYTIGFAESLLDMFQAYIPGWSGIVDTPVNDVRIIGCSTIVLILVLALVGMVMYHLSIIVNL